MREFVEIGFFVLEKDVPLQRQKVNRLFFRFISLQ